MSQENPLLSAIAAVARALDGLRAPSMIIRRVRAVVLQFAEALDDTQRVPRLERAIAGAAGRR